MKRFAVHTIMTLMCLNMTSAVFAAGEKIALIQYDADRYYGEYETNLTNLTRLVGEAIDAGANIIVMPEGSTLGYASGDSLWCRPGIESYRGKNCDSVEPVAELVPGGRTSEYWQAIASQFNVVLLFSVIEKEGGQYFNTTVVLDESGYLGRYRKTYLYWVDQAYASPGSELFVLEVFGKRLGLMICLDVNYAALFQAYKSVGVDGLIVTMDWDQNPYSNRAGGVVMRHQALRFNLDLYVSDQSTWDSTGFYPASGGERIRAPLAAIAVGGDGFVLATLDSRD